MDTEQDKCDPESGASAWEATSVAGGLDVFIECFRRDVADTSVCREHRSVAAAAQSLRELLTPETLAMPITEKYVKGSIKQSVWHMVLRMLCDKPEDDSSRFWCASYLNSMAKTAREVPGITSAVRRELQDYVI